MALDLGSLLVGGAALFTAVLTAIQWVRGRADTRRSDAAAANLAAKEQSFTHMERALILTREEADRARADAERARAEAAALRRVLQQRVMDAAIDDPTGDAEPDYRPELGP